MITLVNRMRPALVAVLFGAVAFAISLHLSAADSTKSTSSHSRTNHVVYIENMQFSPKTLEVKMGDQITWVNNDFVPHTATANDSSWDSKNLSKGEEFSLVVDENTLLEYFCLYHPNMVAKIKVVLHD